MRLVANHLRTTRPLSDDAKAYLRLLLRLPPIRFPESSDHYIYVIGAEKGPVKIGVSFNPIMRLRQLQISTPTPLAILAFAPGSHEMERELHRFYARERLRGEWFRRSRRIGEFIDEMNRRPAHWSAQFVHGRFA